MVIFHCVFFEFTGMYNQMVHVDCYCNSPTWKVDFVFFQIGLCTNRPLRTESRQKLPKRLIAVQKKPLSCMICFLLSQFKVGISIYDGLRNNRPVEQGRMSPYALYQAPCWSAWEWGHPRSLQFAHQFRESYSDAISHGWRLEILQKRW